MGLQTGSVENSRRLNDANFVTSASIWAPLASWNLVQATPFPTTENVQLEVFTTSSIGFTASFTVQDSADNSTFANVTQLNSVTLQATGSAFTSFGLPPTLRQYVRVSSSVTVGSGSYTGSLNM